MAKTHEVRREGNGFRIEERPAVPDIAIGRYVLPKVEPRGQRLQNPLELYRQKVALLNADRGEAVRSDELFMPYVTSEEFRGLVSNRFERIERRKNGGPSRSAYEARSVKRQVATAIEKAQQLDGEHQLAELERIVHDNQGLEPDEEVIVTNGSDDPGPFGLWGTTEIQLRSQPAMIDEYTVGVRAYVRDDLAQSYQGLKAVLRQEAFNVVGMVVNEWDPVIPVFRSFEPISTDPNKALTIPRPPMYVTVQEIKITEL